MPRVLLTHRILDEGLKVIESRGWDFVVADGTTRDRLKESVTQFDAIISMLTNKFDAAVFADAAGGPLRIVANYAVGYDNVDLDAAKQARIWVTNTPDVLTTATAEMAWTLVFAASRRIIEGDTLVRGGEWKGWTPTQLLGRQISGKTVGVIGAGRIGQAFAAMGKGLGVRVHYFARKSKPAFEAATGARWAPLDWLLKESDIISIHLPSTPQTRGLLSAEKLALMKDTAILVNTGRGNVVDEAALAAALRSKKIAAAGLDVYEKEPEVHPDLLTLPNVVLAPHLGSATIESRTAMAERCAKNIEEALAGRRPPDALIELT